MAQFYFLTVLANILTGLTLSSDYLSEKRAVFSGFQKLRESRKYMILLGLSTTAIGILKLIFRSPNETVPVAGDMLPAIFGIGMGVLLLAENLRAKAPDHVNTVPQQPPKRTVFTFVTPIGIVGVITAFLHFLLPGVVIL